MAPLLHPLWILPGSTLAFVARDGCASSARMPPTGSPERGRKFESPPASFIRNPLEETIDPMIRSKSRLVTRHILALALFAAPLLSGCGSIGALARARDIERGTNIERLRFLERVGNAYNLLGLEYYTLAKQAEDSGNDQSAQEYAAKARMYNLFHKEMKQAAAELRTTLRKADGVAEAPEAEAPGLQLSAPPVAQSAQSPARAASPGVRPATQGAPTR